MTETDDALKADKLRLTKKRLFFMKQADLNPGAVGAEWLKDGVQAIDLLQRALTARDAQIERLTELDAQRTVQAIELMDRATTAERERDEARAEVERLKAAELSGISGDLENRIAAALYADGSDLCDVPWEFVPDHMKVGYFSAAKRISAALTKGGENGEG